LAKQKVVVLATPLLITLAAACNAALRRLGQPLCTSGVCIHTHFDCLLLSVANKQSFQITLSHLLSTMPRQYLV
jgi:hypothetical protein